MQDSYSIDSIGARHRISSRWHTTGVVAATVLVALFIFVKGISGGYGGSGMVIAAVFIAAIVLFANYYLAKQPEVYLDDQNLYIIIDGAPMTVPVSQITEVNETWWSRTKYITVKFDRDIGCGEKIRFVPNWPVNWPFISHPVAKELRRAAGLG